MHGQGGAWSLVCGLWVPGDPQFQPSLPVACGALSRATVELPSCSWEQNMDSTSDIGVKKWLEYPDVDQDSKAAKLNDQSTVGIDPELSSDSHRKMNGTCSELPDSEPLASERPKRVRHPDCKHTEEELRRMAQSLKKSRLRKLFVYATYYKGVNPCQKMEELLCKQNPKRTRAGNRPPQGSLCHELPTKETNFLQVDSTQRDSGRVLTTVLSEEQVSASVGQHSGVELETPSVGVTIRCTDSSSLQPPGELGDSRSDTATCNLAKGVEEVPCKENGLTSERPKRFRHPDCKHTKEELKKMSYKVRSIKLRASFMYRTFCKGEEPDQVLGELQSKEQHYGNMKAPREVLKRMSFDLPTMKLRKEFLQATYLGADPYRLTNEMLARKEVRDILDDYRKKRLMSDSSKRPAESDCIQGSMNNGSQDGSYLLDRGLQPEEATKRLKNSTEMQNIEEPGSSGSIGDGKSTSASQDLVELGTFQSADDDDAVTLESPKRVRHPNCKHSEEELLEMSQHLDTQKWRDQFMVETYCEGADPDQTMVDLLGKELDKTYHLGPNIPRTEVKKMGKILPTKELRKYFFQSCMKGQDPNKVMKKFLSRRSVQQKMLKKKLLVSEEQLKFKVFQQPVIFPEKKLSPAKVTRLPFDQHSQKGNENIVPPKLTADSEPKSETPKPTKNVNLPCYENGVAQCEESNPDTSNSDETTMSSLPLKEWLGRFVKEGLTLNTAFRKVKKLILQRENLNKGIETKEGIRPNTVELANQSSQTSSEMDQSRGTLGVAVAGFSDKDLKERPHEFPNLLSKKQRQKRNKMFRKLNEEQMNAYVKWRVQGLGHHWALNEVLQVSQEPGTLPDGVHTPTKKDLPARPGPKNCNPQPDRRFPVSETQQMFLHGGLLGPISLPPGRVSLPTNTQNTSMPQVPCNLFPQFPSGMPPVAVPEPLSSQKRPGFNFEIRVPKRSRFVNDDINQDASSSGDGLHLCIVPTGYPKERLSDDQMNAIESTILDAVIEIKDESMKPVFKGSSHNRGRYEVICKDQLTKTWLYTNATRLYQAWPNASLKIIPVNSIKLKACAVLPLCRNDDSDVILKFIGTQNKELNVGKWEVFQRRNDVENTSLCMFIDEDSAEVLRNCGTIDFKTGIAAIVLIDDLEDEYQQISGLSLENSRTAQLLGVSGDVSMWSSSAGNLEEEQMRIPPNKRHLQFGEPGRSGSSQYNGLWHDPQFETPPDQNIGLLGPPNIGLTSESYSPDNRPSRHNLTERNRLKVSRTRSQEYDHSQYVEPIHGGVSTHNRYKPRMPKRIFGDKYGDYGGPSEHIGQSQSCRTPGSSCNLGRHMSEQSAGKYLARRRPHPEHTSSRDCSGESSVEYDELLRNMVVRCRKDGDQPSSGEPRSKTRGPSEMVGYEPTIHVSWPSIDQTLDCSSTRHGPRHRDPAPGRTTERGRYPPASPYSPGSTFQKRFRWSPPPEKSSHSRRFSSRY